MLPRRLAGCLRLATIGSRAERLAFFRTHILATTTGAARFSSTTSSAGRSAAHGEPSGYGNNRRGPAVDGPSASGGRHITSTAVSVGRLAGGICFRLGGATSAEVLVHCSSIAYLVRIIIAYCTFLFFWGSMCRVRRGGETNLSVQ